VLFAILVTAAVFGRRVQKAAYGQVEGQLGAAAAVLQNMRGNWRVTPAVGFTKEQDLLHRVIGQGGERRHAARERANPVRQWFSVAQPLLGVVVAEAERCDTALSFESAKPEWRERKRCKPRDQRPLFVPGGKCRLITQTVGDPRVVEKNELVAHTHDMALAPPV